VHFQEAFTLDEMLLLCILVNFLKSGQVKDALSIHKKYVATEILLNVFAYEKHMF
jgi:energy-converting hydrogenase A subunit M